MKRIIVLLLIISFCLFLFGCEKTLRIGADNIYRNTQYPDYASVAYLDTDKYPDTAEMGLFWTYWDDVEQKIVEVKADTMEGAALVDPLKPTIIKIHGVLVNGYYQKERYIANTKIADPIEFEMDTDNVSLNYLWLRSGYNVANFHYNRFASEEGSLENMMLSATAIEGKIWGIDGINGMRYRKADGTYTEQGLFNFSIAELFAGEYIRAMRLINNMENSEIRVAAHSMGGVVASTGIFLLTELSKARQINSELLPKRLALLDSYFGNDYLPKLNAGKSNMTIHWSNKKFYEDDSVKTQYECLKVIEAHNIAIEYYEMQDGITSFAGQYCYQRIINLATHTVIIPDYGTIINGYVYKNEGHNGVRDWYYSSIIGNPPLDTNGAVSTSATTPTDIIKSLKGNKYIQSQGEKTLIPFDDVFIKVIIDN